MCNARDAIATISFVAVAEIENGFDGKGTMIGRESGFAPASGWWMCSVESHEAEMTMLCSRLNTTWRTPASWLLSTVCSEVLRSILVSWYKPGIVAGPNGSNLLPHVPVQSSCVDLVLVIAEADVQYRSAVLKLLQ